MIVLTRTENFDIYKMTKSAIDSLRQSESDNTFRVILVESYPNAQAYDVDVEIQYEGKFNYNKALNLAFRHLKSDWVYVSNNDVLFTQNWYSQMRYYMEMFDLDSASPWCPQRQHGISELGQQMILNYPEHAVVVGNEVIVHFCGWGWLMNRQLLDQLRPFPEDLTFWYQDNHLSLQLKTMHKKHAVVTASKVVHFGQKSYPLIPQDDIYRMTKGAEKAFIDKWKWLRP